MKTNPLKELERVKAIRSAYLKNSLLIYFAVMGLERVSEKFGGIDEFKSAISTIYSRNHVPKVLKRLVEARLLMEQATRTELPSPYLEMKEKFIDGFFDSPIF